MGEAFEWDIRVPLVSNVYVLIDLLIAIFLVSGGFAYIVLYLSGFSDFFGVLKLFIVADALFIVAMFIVMGFIFVNLFQLHYRMDYDGIELSVGEFDDRFNKLAWRVSSLIQRYGFMGGRVYLLRDSEQRVPWSNVFRAVFDKRRKVVSLNSESHVLMRVYCTPDIVDRVFSMVQGLVTEPENEGSPS